MFYKEAFEVLSDEIDRLHAEAKDLYRNMQDEQLSFGLLEAEGYLRMAKTISNIVLEIKEEITETEKESDLMIKEVSKEIITFNNNLRAIQDRYIMNIDY